MGFVLARSKASAVPVLLTDYSLLCSRLVARLHPRRLKSGPKWTHMSSFPLICECSRLVGWNRE